MNGQSHTCQFFMGSTEFDKSFDWEYCTDHKNSINNIFRLSLSTLIDLENSLFDIIILLTNYFSNKKGGHYLRKYGIKDKPLNWYSSMKIFLEPKTSKTYFNAIFVISAVLLSSWKTFIKFRWPCEKFTLVRKIDLINFVVSFLTSVK